MSDTEKLLLLDRHLQAENGHRLDDTLATLTDDCVFFDTALETQWVGHEGAAAHYDMWWSAFETNVTGDRLHMADESAVAETTWRGTHVGEFLGIAPTGRPIELAVAIMVELRDGLMSAERMYWDRGRLWQQLGIVDPDRGPATA